jgi:hypothetical protein
VDDFVSATRLDGIQAYAMDKLHNVCLPPYLFTLVFALPKCRLITVS